MCDLDNIYILALIAPPSLEKALPTCLEPKAPTTNSDEALVFSFVFSG